jgi:uncharacterized protein (DUF1919 family)
MNFDLLIIAIIFIALLACKVFVDVFCVFSKLRKGLNESISDIFKNWDERKSKMAKEALSVIEKYNSGVGSNIVKPFDVLYAVDPYSVIIDKKMRPMVVPKYYKFHSGITREYLIAKSMTYEKFKALVEKADKDFYDKGTEEVRKRKVEELFS